MYEVVINYLPSCSWQVSYCFLPYADTNFVQNKSSTTNCSGYDKAFPSQGWTPCSATLNLNKWGKHHKLIPPQRPHPWGHSIHQTNRDWSKALTSKTTSTLQTSKSYSGSHLNGLLCPHGFSWIPCVLLGPRDAQSQAAKATLKLKEKQSMFSLCPRKYQYCFWAGTASFCSPEFREQTMATDFTWHH